MEQGPLWIFGYGSLVWRPAFSHAERRPARLRGFARRFWQGSTDHRGTPDAPGRVVTLIPEPDAVCTGVAFRVADSSRPQVLARLDHREKGGYERREVDLLLGGRSGVGERVRGLVYLASEGNPNYLGPAATHAIAHQVLRSCGPSGANLDYVLHLAAALRRLGADDDHVFEVEAAVRRHADADGRAAS